MAIPMDYIRKRLGWCLNECPVMERAGMKPERYMDAVPSGRGGLRSSDFSWWNRYRNQVMMMAVNLTIATIALFLLLDDALGGIRKGIVLGIVIGISAGCVTLWHSWKRYDRIEAGEFIEVRETTEQRMIRYGGIVIISFAVIAWMVFQMFNAATHMILGTVVGACIVIWVVYFTVYVWERRRHKMVIAKKRSMYAIDME